MHHLYSLSNGKSLLLVGLSDEQGGPEFELCRHFIQLLVLKIHIGLNTKNDLLQQMR